MPYIKAPTPQSQTGAPGILDVYRSSNVYVNNVPVALWDSAQSSQAASQSQILSPTFTIDQLVNELDGDETFDYVNAAHKELINTGAVASNSFQNVTLTQVYATSSGSLPSLTPTFNTSTVDLSQLEFPDDYQLSPNYTLGQMTKSPNVMYEYQVQPSRGLTTAEVVANLEMLTNNCVEPVKAQYSNMFVTNSFRVNTKPNSRSQHPLGQACDMQFTAIPNSEYYNIAVWIRDNVLFDQLLLEYKTTGSGLPWIHISYNSAGNRRQVKTFVNNLSVNNTELEQRFPS